MFKHVYILVNERSGGFSGRAQLHHVTQQLEQLTIPFDIYKTICAKHAYLLTVQIVEKMKHCEQALFLVIGGDGTVHEVVDCLQQLQISLPIGYVPAGTGNDFARNLYDKQSPHQILQRILSSKFVAEVPILKVNHTIALNSFGIGFDAHVTHQVNRSRFKDKLNAIKLGSLIYLLYTLKHLWTFKTVSVDVTLQQNKQRVSHQNCYLTTVMNNGYFGGGILLDPTINLMDKLFSIIVIKNVTLKAIFRFLPKLFRGKHLNDFVLTRYTGTSVTITPTSKHLAQIDGEMYPATQQPTHYCIQLACQLFYL